MSIIGQAEGKGAVTLPRVAEDSKALLNLMQTDHSRIWCPAPKQPVCSHDGSVTGFAPYKSQDEFRDLGRLLGLYSAAYEIRSLNGEEVKSFEECEIANFLYLNGSPLRIRAPLRTRHGDFQETAVPTGFLSHGRRRLHRALRRCRRRDTRRAFIDEEDYLRSMEWKRQLHAEHGTILIETFSHEHSAGRLLRNLEAELKAHGVELSPGRSRQESLRC